MRELLEIVRLIRIKKTFRFLTCVGGFASKKNDCLAMIDCLWVFIDFKKREKKR